jgi:hypothetical protein
MYFPIRRRIHSGGFEFPVFSAQTFQFQPKRLARHRTEAAPDLHSKRPTKISTDRATCDGERDFRCTLENSPERLANGRLDESSDCLASLTYQVTEKLLQLLLAVDFQELGGQLHFQCLAEHTSAPGCELLLRLEVLHRRRVVSQWISVGPHFEFLLKQWVRIAIVEEVQVKRRLSTCNRLAIQKST